MPKLHTEATSPFDRHYGLRVLRCDESSIEGVLEVDDHHLQPTGVVHGGVYASMAEALASFGTNWHLAGSGEVGLGLSNATNFVRPVRGGQLRALGHARHRGRTTWVWDVTIDDDDQRPCAMSRVTIAVRPLDPGRREELE